MYKSGSVDFLEVDFETGSKAGPSNDPVRAANVFGRQFSRSELAADTEGRKLIQLMEARRRGDYNKGGALVNLGKGLTSWGMTDIPFYGWVADIGTTAGDAIDISKTMTKLQNGEKVTAHEALQARRYMLEQELESTRSTAYTIGSTVKQMIPFMAEMFISSIISAGVGAGVGAAAGGGIGAVPGAVVGAVVGAVKAGFKLFAIGGAKTAAKKVVNKTMASIAEKQATALTAADIASVTAEATTMFGEAGVRSAMAEALMSARRAAPGITRTEARQHMARTLAESLQTATLKQNRELSRRSVMTLVGGDAQNVIHSAVQKTAENFILSKAGATTEKMAKAGVREYNRMLAKGWKAMGGASSAEWQAFREQIGRGVATGLNGSTVDNAFVRGAMQASTGEFVNLKFAERATKLLFDDAIRNLELRMGSDGAVVSGVERLAKYIGDHAARGLLQTEHALITGGSGTVAHGGMSGFYRCSDALKEGIGRVFIEAPVKAAVQLGTTMPILAPLFAAASGHDPMDVTFRGQLGFQTNALLTGDRRNMETARMVAAGSMFVEYMSESAGRGLGLLAGGAVGGALGKTTEQFTAGVSRMRQTLMSNAITKEAGGILSKAVDAIWGSGDLKKGGIDKLVGLGSSYVGRLARKRGVANVAEADIRNALTTMSFDKTSDGFRQLMAAEGIKSARDLQSRVFATELNKNRRQVFFASIGANLLRRGWTPDRIIRGFSAAGYDGVLEEMGEERLGDFVRGLFHLDDTASDAEVSEHVKSMFSGFLDPKQLMVEMIAFSIPAAVRTTAVQTQRWIANGSLARATDSATRLGNLTRVASVPVVVHEVNSERDREALAAHEARAAELREAAYGTRTANVQAVTGNASAVFANRASVGQYQEDHSDTLPGELQGAFSGIAAAQSEEHMRGQLEEFADTLAGIDDPGAFNSAVSDPKVREILGDAGVAAVKREWRQKGQGRTFDESDPVEIAARAYDAHMETAPSVTPMTSVADAAETLFAQTTVSGPDVSITADEEARAGGSSKALNRTVSEDVLDTATSDGVTLFGEMGRAMMQSHGRTSFWRGLLSKFVGAASFMATGDISLVAANPAARTALDAGLDRRLVVGGTGAYIAGIVAGYRKIRGEMSESVRAKLDEALASGTLKQTLAELNLPAPELEKLERAGAETFEGLVRDLMQSYLAGCGIVALSKEASKAVAEQVIRARRESGSSESTDYARVHDEVLNGVIALAANGMVYNSNSQRGVDTTFLTVDVRRAMKSGTKAEVLAAILDAPAFRSISRTHNLSGLDDTVNATAFSLATSNTADFNEILSIDPDKSEDLTESEINSISKVFAIDVTAPHSECQKTARKALRALRLASESLVTRYEDQGDGSRRAYIIPSAGPGARTFTARVVDSDGVVHDTVYSSLSAAKSQLENESDPVYGNFAPHERRLVVSSIRDFASSDATSIVMLLAGNDREVARNMFLRELNATRSASDAGLREEMLPPNLRKQTVNRNGVQTEEFVQTDAEAAETFRNELAVAQSVRLRGDNLARDWVNYDGATEEEKRKNQKQAVEMRDRVFGPRNSGAKSGLGYESVASRIATAYGAVRNQSVSGQVEAIGLPSDSWVIHPECLSFRDVVVLTPNYDTAGQTEAILRMGLRNCLETYLGSGDQADSHTLRLMFGQAARTFRDCAYQMAAELEADHPDRARRLRECVDSVVDRSASAVPLSALATIASSSMFFSGERGLRSQGNGYFNAVELAEISDRFRDTPIFPIFMSAVDEACGGSGFFHADAGSVSGLTRFYDVFARDPQEVLEGRKSAAFSSDGEPAQPFIPSFSLRPGLTKDMIGADGVPVMSVNRGQTTTGFDGDALRGYAAPLSSACQKFAKAFLSVAKDGRTRLSAAEVYRMAVHSDLFGGEVSASSRDSEAPAGRAGLEIRVVAPAARRALKKDADIRTRSGIDAKTAKDFGMAIRMATEGLPNFRYDEVIQAHLESIGTPADVVSDIMEAYSSSELRVDVQDDSRDEADKTERDEVIEEAAEGKSAETAWDGAREAAVAGGRDTAALAGVFKWLFRAEGGNVAFTFDTVKSAMLSESGLTDDAVRAATTGRFACSRTTDEVMASVRAFKSAMNPYSDPSKFMDAQAKDPFNHWSHAAINQMLDDVIRVLMVGKNYSEALALSVIRNVPEKDGRQRSFLEMMASMTPLDAVAIHYTPGSGFSFADVGSVREESRTGDAVVAGFSSVLRSSIGLEKSDKYNAHPSLFASLCGQPGPGRTLDGIALALADAIGESRSTEGFRGAPRTVFTVNNVNGWPAGDHRTSKFILADTVAEANSLHAVLNPARTGNRKALSDVPFEDYVAAVDSLVGTIRRRAGLVADAVDKALGTRSEFSRMFRSGALFANIRHLAVDAYGAITENTDKDHLEMYRQSVQRLYNLANYFTAVPGYHEKKSGAEQLWRTSQAFSDAVEEPLEAIGIALGVPVATKGSFTANGRLTHNNIEWRKNAAAIIRKSLEQKFAGPGVTGQEIARRVRRYMHDVLSNAGKLKTRWAANVDLGASRRDILAAQGSKSEATVVGRGTLADLVDRYIASGPRANQTVAGHAKDSATVKKTRAVTTLPTQLPAMLRAAASDTFAKLGLTEELARNNMRWDDGTSPIVAVVGAKDSNGMPFDKSVLAGILNTAIGNELGEGKPKDRYLFPLFRGDKPSCYAVQIPARLVDQMLARAMTDADFRASLPANIAQPLGELEKMQAVVKPRPTGRAAYVQKDMDKFSVITKFVGFGSDGSSTEKYRTDTFKDMANTGKYSASDIVGVSVNGNRPGRVRVDGGRFAVELKLALDAGATIVADAKTDRERSFNVGERELAEVLTGAGYREIGTTGIWKKPVRITDSALRAKILDGDSAAVVPGVSAGDLVYVGSEGERAVAVVATGSGVVRANLASQADIARAVFGKARPVDSEDTEADRAEKELARDTDEAALRRQRYVAAYGLVAHATGQSQIDAKRVMVTLSTGTAISMYAANPDGTVDPRAGLYCITTIGGRTGTQSTGSYTLYGKVADSVSKLMYGEGRSGVAQKLHIYDMLRGVTAKKGQGFAFGLGFYADRGRQTTLDSYRYGQAVVRREIEDIIGLDNGVLAPGMEGILDPVPPKADSMSDGDYADITSRHDAAVKAALELAKIASFMHDDLETNKAGIFGSRAGFSDGMQSIVFKGKELFRREGKDWVRGADLSRDFDEGIVLGEIKNHQVPLASVLAAAAATVGDISEADVMGWTADWTLPTGQTVSGKTLAESGLLSDGDKLLVRWDPKVKAAHVRYFTRSLSAQIVARNADSSKATSDHTYPVNATRDEEILEALSIVSGAARSNEFTDAFASFTALQLAMIEHSPAIMTDVLASDMDLVQQLREHPDDPRIVEAVADKIKTFFKKQLIPGFTGSHGVMSPSAVNGHVIVDTEEPGESIDSSNATHLANLDRVPGATDYDMDLLRPAPVYGSADRRITGMDRGYASGLANTTSETFRYGMHADADAIEKLYRENDPDGVFLADPVNGFASDEVPSGIDAELARKIAFLVSWAEADRLAAIKSGRRSKDSLGTRLLSCFTSYTGDTADKLWNAGTISFADLFVKGSDGRKKFDYAALSVRKDRSGQPRLFVAGSFFCAHRSPSGNIEAFSGVARASAPVDYDAGRNGRPGEESIYTLDGITMYTQGSDTDGDSAGVQVRDDVEDDSETRMGAFADQLVKLVKVDVDGPGGVPVHYIDTDQVFSLAASSGWTTVVGGVEVVKPEVFRVLQRRIFDAQVGNYRRFGLVHQGYMPESKRQALAANRKAHLDAHDPEYESVRNYADDVYAGFEFADTYAEHPELTLTEDGRQRKLFDLGFSGRSPVGPELVFAQPFDQASVTKLMSRLSTAAKNFVGLDGKTIVGVLSAGRGKNMTKLFDACVNVFEPPAKLSIDDPDTCSRMSDAAADSSSARGVSVKYQSRILRAFVREYGLHNLTLRNADGYSPLVDLTSHLDGVSNNLFDTLKKMFATRAGWTKALLPFFVGKIALHASEYLASTKGARLDNAFFFAEAINFLAELRDPKSALHRLSLWTDPVNGRRRFISDNNLTGDLDWTKAINAAAKAHDRSKEEGPRFYGRKNGLGVWTRAADDGKEFSQDAKLAMLAEYNVTGKVTDASELVMAQRVIDKVEGYGLLVDLPARVDESASDYRRKNRKRGVAAILANESGAVRFDRVNLLQSAIGEATNRAVGNTASSYDNMDSMFDEILDEVSSAGEASPASRITALLSGRLQYGADPSAADAEAVAVAVEGPEKGKRLVNAPSGSYKSYSVNFDDKASAVEMHENLDRLVHTYGLLIPASSGGYGFSVPEYMGGSVKEFCSNLASIVNAMALHYSLEMTPGSSAAVKLAASFKADESGRSISIPGGHTSRDVDDMRAGFEQMMAFNGTFEWKRPTGSVAVRVSDVARMIMLYAGMTKPYGAATDYIGDSSLPALFDQRVVRDIERHRKMLANHPAAVMLAAVKPERVGGQPVLDIFDPVFKNVVSKLAAASSSSDMYERTPAETLASTAVAEDNIHNRSVEKLSTVRRRKDGSTYTVKMKYDSKHGGAASQAEIDASTLSGSELEYARPMETRTYVGMQSGPASILAMNNMFAAPYLDDGGRVRFGKRRKKGEKASPFGYVYLEDAVNAAMKLEVQRLTSDQRRLNNANARLSVNKGFGPGMGVIYSTPQKRSSIVETILEESIRGGSLSNAQALYDMVASGADFRLTHKDKDIAAGFMRVAAKIAEGRIARPEARELDGERAQIAAVNGGNARVNVPGTDRVNFFDRVEKMFPGAGVLARKQAESAVPEAVEKAMKAAFGDSVDVSVVKKDGAPTSLMRVRRTVKTKSGDRTVVTYISYGDALGQNVPVDEMMESALATVNASRTASGREKLTRADLDRLTGGRAAALTGILKASGMQLGESVSGHDLGFAPAMSGVIKLGVDANFDTLFHEYYHQMVACFKTLGVLTAEDEAKVNGYYGDEESAAVAYAAYLVGLEGNDVRLKDYVPGDEAVERVFDSCRNTSLALSMSMFRGLTDDGAPVFMKAVLSGDMSAFDGWDSPSSAAVASVEAMLLGEKKVFDVPRRMTADQAAKVASSARDILDGLVRGDDVSGLIDEAEATARTPARPADAPSRKSGHADAPSRKSGRADAPSRDVIGSVSTFLKRAMERFSRQETDEVLRAQLRTVSIGEMESVQNSDLDAAHLVFNVRALLRRVAIAEGFEIEDANGELTETGRRLLTSENAAMLALRLFHATQAEHDALYMGTDQAYASHVSADYVFAHALEKISPSMYGNHARALADKSAAMFRSAADSLSRQADAAEARGEDGGSLRSQAASMYETGRLVIEYADAMAQGRDIRAMLARAGHTSANRGNLHGLFYAIVTGGASFYEGNGWANGGGVVDETDDAARQADVPDAEGNVSLDPRGIRRYAPGTSALPFDVTGRAAQLAFDYAGQALFVAKAARSFARQVTGVGRDASETAELRGRLAGSENGVGTATVPQLDQAARDSVEADLEAGLGKLDASLTTPKYDPDVPESWFETVDMTSSTPDWIMANPGMWLRGDMQRSFGGMSMRDAMTDHSIRAVTESGYRLASDFTQFFGFDAYKGLGVRKLEFATSNLGRNENGDFAISDDYAHTNMNFSRTNGYLFGIFTTGEDRVGRMSADDVENLGFLVGQTVKSMVNGDDRVLTGIRIRDLVEFGGREGMVNILSDEYLSHYSIDKVLDRFSDKSGKGERFTTIDNVVKRIHEEIPPALRDRIATEVLTRLHSAAVSWAKKADENEATGKPVSDPNFSLADALTREFHYDTRTETVDGKVRKTKTLVHDVPLATKGRKGDIYISVPVAMCVQAWNDSDVKSMLQNEGGRPAQLLDLHYWAGKFRKELRKVNEAARKSPYLSTGAGAFFTSAGQPRFWWHEGAGSHKANVDRHLAANDLFRDMKHSSSERLEEIQNSMFGRIEKFRPDVLKTAAFPGGDAFTLSRSLMEKLAEIAGAKDMQLNRFALAIRNGEFASGNVPIAPDATVLDIVLLVNQHESEKNFAEIAAASGLPAAERQRLLDVRTVCDMVSERLKNEVPGYVDCRSELENFRYGNGKLGQATTAPEALVQMLRDIVTAEKFRGTMAQMLTSVGPDGSPLFVVSPTDEMATVNKMPDEYWGALARFVADRMSRKTGGAFVYDAAKSGVENMRAIYDAVRKSQEDSRYHKLPSSKYFVSDMFQGDILCLNDDRDSAGNVNVLTKAQGGEAACYMRQLLATVRAPTNNAAWRVLDSISSWTKLASVGFSAFFQIATAIESPTAAVGFWHTFMGYSKTGAKIARGIGKAIGRHGSSGAFVDDAVFMSDFKEMINSNDPFIVELRELCDLIGMPLEQAVPFENDENASNPVLGNAGTVQRQSRDIVRFVEGMRTLGKVSESFARGVKRTLDYLYKHPTDYTFNVVLNGVKMAVVAQTMRRLREEARYSDRPFDPVRELRRYSTYLNAEVGGLDPARYAWATPMMRKVLSNAMFSWQWTVGAWSAGGGDVVSDMLFGGSDSTPAMRQWTFIRWLRMLGIVKFGIPVVLHAAIKALSKFMSAVLPPPPDEKEKEKEKEELDDEIDEIPWFAPNNEQKAGAIAIDVTPMLKLMNRVPGVKAAKEADVPVLSSLIPAYVGGGRNTTGKRRYYMHFGKQSDEFFRWFEDPLSQALAKTSIPMQKILEGMFGRLQPQGYSKAFADKSLLERWVNFDLGNPDESALANLLWSMTSFSWQSSSANPDAGVFSWIGPMRMGQSKRSTRLRIAERLQEFVDDDRSNNPWSYRKNKAKLNLMCFDILREAKLNGVDPADIMTSALGDLAKAKYMQLMSALPRDAKENKFDVKTARSAIRALVRINRKYTDIKNSVVERYKAGGTDAKKSKEFYGALQELIKSTVNSPFMTDEDMQKRLDTYFSGTAVTATNMAARGGENFGNFLATDDVPDTLFGVPIVASGHTEEDLEFFREHPEAGGYYDMGEVAGQRG